MPNAEPRTSSTVATVEAAEATPTASYSPEQPAAAESSSISSQAAELAAEKKSNGDAWFQDDEAGQGAGDDWLAGNQPELPEPSTQSDETDTAALAHTSGKTNESKSSSSGAQHGSSMSFARTVSHDINFHDDDEGDWDLSRTDTDPFKFMPPSDRTNSFPVVPPQTTDQNVVDQPLSSTQATAILEEDDADEATQDLFTGEPQQSHNPSGSIGGQIQDFEAQVSDERYEEGIPLLSQATEASLQPTDSVGAQPVVSFEDDGGDDDFFGTVSQDKANEPTEEQPQLLERKSTMQVMGGALGSAGTFQTFDIQESLQEEDEEEATPNVESNEAVEDVDAKWQAAFGGNDDDDDFLLEDNAAADDQIDPAAFLGSDDEGLLDELEDEPTQQPQSTGNVGAAAANPYMPHGAATQRTPSAYTPAANVTPNPAASSAFYKPPPAAAPFGGAQQPQAPPTEPSRMQSFADKAKGGYASPYDLPTDLVSSKVKPRKRASMQQMAEPASAQPPPPANVRSASMFTPGPPSSTLSPPTSSHGLPPVQKNAAPPLRNKGSFFEELPMQSKVRPSSRQNSIGPGPPTPQSAGQSPPTSHGQMAPPPPPSSNAYAASQQQTPAGHGASSDVAGLVAPEKTNPYASLQSAAPIMPAVSSNSARYSPAPSQQPSSSVPPAAVSARYSPAPTLPRSQSSYSVAPAPQTPTGAPMLPHQPRTSSPLAHFEINRTKSQGDVSGPNAEPGLPERRASASAYEPRLNRVASLPPTREVEEEEDKPGARAVSASQTSPPPTARQRYSPAPAPVAAGMVSPPTAPPTHQTLSPTGRSTSNYMPQSSLAGQAGFAPPPRAQTGSPSAAYGITQQLSASGGRPASAHAQTAPTPNKAPQTVYAPTTRARGRTMEFNMVPPNDSRAQDPLQRWKGAALLTWGVGGTVVTCFPKSIPRYGMNQTTPSIIRSHGEVQVRTIKDIDPLQDRLAKFPGPLRGKSKKKETLTWLSAGIESIEKDLPDVSFNSELSLEAKRSIERLLLWKILRVFIEYDGALEGSAPVEKAVRDILAPGTTTPTSNNDALFPTASGYGSQSGAMTAMSSDGVDASAMEQIRQDLLKGNREGAVWAAVDKRLWGHAMLISQTVSTDLYKRVSQEFVRKEVNYPGHQNESLGALYKILSGNHDDCVDELVPSHARAGLQLVSTAVASNATGSTADGLDKWRETLSLVLGNRSQDDVKGLKALGNLLASYGRAEAAHVCYLFSRSVSVFGGLDDPNADFVLLGSDHKRQSDQFAKETEALELSEVYEYGLTLAGTVAASAGTPHLAAYKLQHAITLAEYGFRDRALQYCEAIVAAMTGQTRRSAYHHAVLEGAVDDFMRRLKQAPKGESGSWMSKPSMNKLSGSLLSKFNTFVSGDEGDGSGNGGEGETGHFARIATTPNMSRSPSVSNFEMYGSSPGVAPGLMSPPAMGAIASKYAPMAGSTLSTSPYDPSPYAPAQVTTADRDSGDHSRNVYAPSYPGADSATQGSGYVPPTASEPTAGYQSLETNASYGGYQPHASAPAEQPVVSPQLNGPIYTGPTHTEHAYEPPSYGYQAPETASSAPKHQESTDDFQQGSSGYEPPSYGYQAPSYEPDVPTEANDDDEAKPKKKSFMDDDDDDIPALRPAAQKSRAEIDKENQEMFRKAAEEDGEYRSAFVDRPTTDRIQPNAQLRSRARRRAGALGAGSAARKLMPHLSAKQIRTSLYEPSSASQAALCTILS